jgi:hypothetical protein
MKLNQDARALLSAHHAARTRARLPDGKGLYSLDEWARTLPSTYEFQHATIVPPSWPRARALTLDEYRAKFESRFGEVAAIVRSTENVCVCGGAALAPFCDQADDVDVFLFGLNERQMWLKAQELTDKIRAAYAHARRITQELSPGIITVRVYTAHMQEAAKIQIIMRMYESMARVAHSFDIAVCGVAFDGADVHITPLAAFELLHRVIVVVPAYRSRSFGHRLAKYHARGFATLMLDASFKNATPLEPLTVGDVRVVPSAVCARMLVGTISPIGPACGSDYEPTRHGARWRNVHQLASREFRFVITGTLVGHQCRPLPLASFAATPPTLTDVLSRRELDTALRDSAHAAVSSGSVNVRVLRRVFRLSDAEIAAFTVAATPAVLESRRVDATESLRRFATPILVLYDSLPERIEWVPHCYFSSCRTPTPKTPEQWYGAFFAKTRAPSKREVIAMLHARIAATGRALDGTCALCFCEVHAGGRNSVTLQCGHTFHFGETPAGCRGLSAWAKQMCPLCRQPFAHTDAPKQSAATRLEVAWPEA